MEPTCKDFLQVGSFFIFPEVRTTDYKTEYIELLKEALAAETETVRLYVALLALAPAQHMDKFLELNADETDHQAIIADLLLEAAAGESADQEEMVPGVE